MYNTVVVHTVIDIESTNCSRNIHVAARGVMECSRRVAHENDAKTTR